MPTVSGNVGAVFNGGTITRELVAAPTGQFDTAMEIFSPSGSSAVGIDQFRVWDDTATNQLVTFDAAGDALFILPSLAQFSVKTGGHLVFFVDVPSTQAAFQLPAGYTFVVSDHAGSPLINVLEATRAVGFFGQTPAAKPTVTGSKGANAALASLMTALAALGLVTDSTT